MAVLLNKREGEIGEREREREGGRERDVGSLLIVVDGEARAPGQPPVMIKGSLNLPRHHLTRSGQPPLQQ